MRGFGLTREERELAGEFSETQVPPPVDIGALVREQPARYNIAPTQPVLTVRVDQRAIAPAQLRWGIGLSGGKARQLINVRADTALKGGLFRVLLDRHRVLIPASWFYEWRRAGASKRGQPMMIAPVEGQHLALAGLEGRWTDPKTGDTVPGVVIMTTLALFATSAVSRPKSPYASRRWTVLVEPGSATMRTFTRWMSRTARPTATATFVPRRR